MKSIIKNCVVLILSSFSALSALVEKPEVGTLKELSRIITDRSLSMEERGAAVEKIDGDGYSYCAKALISEIDNIYLTGEASISESWTKRYPCADALVRIGHGSMKHTMNTLAKPQPEARRRLLLDVMLRLDGLMGLQKYNFVMRVAGGRPFGEGEPADPTKADEQPTAEDVLLFRAPPPLMARDEADQDMSPAAPPTEPRQDTPFALPAPPRQEVPSTSAPTLPDLPWPVKATALLATFGLVLLMLKRQLRNEP